MLTYTSQTIESHPLRRPAVYQSPVQSPAHPLVAHTPATPKHPLHEDRSTHLFQRSPKGTACTKPSAPESSLQSASHQSPRPTCRPSGPRIHRQSD
ncbi:hypothetical protein BDZ89DRAFT_359599 [Hymenopellis radicata]|nr:hypothetical protein BDZ89DRAFT_359599 [Hymenopellis radicata]